MLETRATQDMPVTANGHRGARATAVQKLPQLSAAETVGCDEQDLAFGSQSVCDRTQPSLPGALAARPLVGRRQNGEVEPARRGVRHVAVDTHGVAACFARVAAGVLGEHGREWAATVP